MKSKHYISTIFILLILSLTALAYRNPTILTVSLSQGQVGAVYSSQLQAKFGSKPYKWSISVGSLPASLALNTKTGVIYGVPSLVGTSGFTVKLIDSSNRSVTQTLSIQIISGTPVILPVSLTTTSVPNGVTSSPYTTTLQAVYGTTPYVWSISAGSLPAGLSISSSTGIISGTPTIVGNSTFVAEVTDATAGISTHTYTISIVSSSGPYIFSDGFENGNISAWQNTGYSAETSVVHTGIYAAGTHYIICSDPTNSACGASHQDSNLEFQKSWNTNALSDIWTRGYFYIKHPEVGGSTTIGRKLFYFTAGCFTCSQFPNGDPYSIIVAVDDCTTCGYPGAGPLRMNFTQQQNAALVGGSGQSFVSDCGTSNPGPLTGVACALQYNTWYSLEMQTHYSTGAITDGHINIWINGTQVYDWPWSLNRGTAYHLQLFRLGAQVDRDNYLPVDEFRYWDDIVFNDSYIGP